MFCSLSYVFFFIGDKIDADHFKDKITPSLNSDDRLKLDQDVVMDLVREKVKPQCKLSYKLLKEEYGNDLLLEVYPYPTFIQLNFFLGGIHHCFTVVGSWIFYGNFIFALPLTK